MTPMHHAVKRSLTRLCWFAAMLLSACGPGTGGTGTGPNPVSSPSTSTSAYYTSAGTGATPAPNCPASCSGTLDSQALSLQLQTERITLSSPCATFTYAGAWSVSATQNTTVQGVLESIAVVNGLPSRTSQSATLTLQFAGSADASPSLVVRIEDSAGRLLLGPVTLQRTATTPAASLAAGC